MRRFIFGVVLVLLLVTSPYAGSQTTNPETQTQSTRKDRAISQADWNAMQDACKGGQDGLCLMKVHQLADKMGFEITDMQYKDKKNRVISARDKTK